MSMVDLTMWMSSSHDTVISHFFLCHGTERRSILKAVTSHTSPTPCAERGLAYPLPVPATVTIDPAPSPAIPAMQATALDRPRSEYLPTLGKRKRAVLPAKVKGSGVTLRSVTPLILILRALLFLRYYTESHNPDG
jgi:hypothetical protein